MCMPKIVYTVYEIKCLPWKIKLNSHSKYLISNRYKDRSLHILQRFTTNIVGKVKGYIV